METGFSFISRKKHFNISISSPANLELVKSRVNIMRSAEDRLLTLADDDLRGGEDLAVAHQVAGESGAVLSAQHHVQVAGLPGESSHQGADLEMFLVGHNLHDVTLVRHCHCGSQVSPCCSRPPACGWRA